MPPTKRPYPPEFRREAVELVRILEKPIVQVARDLGISNQTLHNWIKQADVDAGKAEGLTTEEREGEAQPKRNQTEPLTTRSCSSEIEKTPP